ncbi:MAG: hypothetical protein MUF18_18755, partial [Fimbriiglobus sp.]|nr:hypothetical protein [Fimbriiglobus sp.]
MLPVFERLRERGFLPWIDRHDYPYGRGSRATQSRGWCVQELAWAELLQDNLIHAGGPALLNVTLPLYFVPPNDSRLPRSVWQTGRERGPFRPAGVRRVDWAVEQIIRFVTREQHQTEQVAGYALQSTLFRNQLLAKPGLSQRVTQFSPTLTPPAPAGATHTSPRVSL